MVRVYHPYSLRQQDEHRASRKAVLALIFALAVPITVGAGYTLDTVRGYAVQARLSHAVDAAALAGGRVMFDDQRDGHVRTFFETMFPNGFLGAHTGPLAIADDPRAGTLTVSAHATMKTLFTRLLGGSDLKVEAQSIVRLSGGHGRKAP